MSTMSGQGYGYGQQSWLTDPQIQDAIGILSASGPSRMPTNLGQVFAQGEQTGNTLRSQGMQNLIQGIGLQRQLDYLNALSSGRIPGLAGSVGAPASAPAQTPQAPASASSGVNSDTPSGQDNPLFMDTSQFLAEASHAPSTVTPGGAGSNPSGLAGAASGGGAQPSPGGLAASLGVPQDDPILNDPQIQYDLYLSRMAPDANTQGQWLSKARLDYDMRAGTPEYKGRVEAAEAAAEMPFKVRESLAGQLGRVTQINPGEGQIAVSGLSLADPRFLSWLTGENMGGGSAPGAPALGGGGGGGSPEPVAGTGSDTSITPRPNMSGVPTPMVATPGGVNTQQAVYNTALQKELAAGDAKYADTLQTNADAAAQGRQNVDEMWQAYNNGIFTGKWADFKESFVKGATALGIPAGDLDSKVTSTEIFTKNQANLGIQLAKSVSSRPSQFEFKYLNGNAVANPELQKATIPIMLSQMEGSQVYAQQKATYVNDMMRTGVNPRQAALDFDTNASTMPYVLQAMAARDPQSYAILRGQMQSTATGRAFAAQVEREAAWMKKAGLLNVPSMPAPQAQPAGAGRVTIAPGGAPGDEQED